MTEVQEIQKRGCGVRFRLGRGVEILGSSFGVYGILLAIPDLQIKCSLRLLGRLGYGEVQGILFSLLMSLLLPHCIMPF